MSANDLKTVPLTRPAYLDQLVGVSRAIQTVRDEAVRAAKTDAKVLITGETGTGKEVVAQIIHEQSQRRSTPMVAINCAGVPDSLLESELFGHTRGSFTGAYRDRVGLLEVAHRGTLFLDEVGEMSLRMQALLLRFMEDGEIQPVGGGRRQVRLDTRLVAATHRDLVARVETKDFREDLYYRLNVIHLTIPPLRERREDIPVLTRHFLRACCTRYRISMFEIPSDIIACMTTYDWPGNARELRNVVERIALRTAFLGQVRLSDLPSEIAPSLHADVVVQGEVQTSIADLLFERMTRHGESFWSAVYPLFMSRDISRDDLRAIIIRGLEESQGSYKLMVQLFNMRREDYKRFLNLLRKYECHIAFQDYRTRRSVLKFESSRDNA
jgi:transcriptional regulator with PAS, ATPase and Fis domain